MRATFAFPVVLIVPRAIATGRWYCPVSSLMLAVSSMVTSCTSPKLTGVAFAMSVRVPNNTPEPKLYMDDLSRSTVVDSAATFYPVGKVLAALMIFLETMEG